MNCPKCSCHDIRVVDTLPDEEQRVFRRRKCTGCGFIFHTVETIDNGTFAFEKRLIVAGRLKRERRKNDQN